MNEPNISIEKIDPDTARAMLEANTHNRNLRSAYVRQIAEDMTAGNWRVNGETIKLAADGTLLDGQHRLAAIVESGCTIEMVIVRGLEHADQETMDTGTKRTLGDVLALRNEESASHLAAAISAFWRSQRGLPHSNGSPTTQQALALLAAHPDLRGSVSAVTRASRALRIPHGLCAALHYEMSALNPEDAADYWTKLATGLGLHERHPLYVLRRRLEENASTMGRKLDRTTIHAYLIKTWNAYRGGRDVTYIRWTRGGASPEPFPELV